MNIDDGLTDVTPRGWIESAVDLIGIVLRDRKAGLDERVRAAMLIGSTGLPDDALAETFLGIAGSADEPDELRGAVAVSLGPVLQMADEDGFEEPVTVGISEQMFLTIQEALRALHGDAAAPKLVRQRALETSVRAQRAWHEGAVRQAYDDGDAEWKLTAVFCMNYVEGFEQQIIESLDSDDPRVFHEAVGAAGAWQLDAAWPRIVGLIKPPTTDKALLFAAIDAVAVIRPNEAGVVLVDLMQSGDEEIEEYVHEALALAEGVEGADGYDDEDDTDLNDEEDVD